MFGYISPDLTRLTETQRMRYRRMYCGLCHSLRSRFGLVRGLSLSNDMTFLAILLSSVYEPASAVRSSRCPVHPLRRHEFQASSMIDYAADMNILLFYLRCVDRRQDHDSRTGGAAEGLFRAGAEQVRKQYPLQSARIEEALRELWRLEKTDDPNPDVMCGLSGKMLGASFVPDPDDIWAEPLYAVGSGLGRFVYWMDAWEDLEADRKEGRYNPLNVWYGRDDYEDFCRKSMEMLMAEAVEPFEFLPLEKDLDIMRNILYSGVWQRYVLRMRKRFGKEVKLDDE